MTTLTVKSIKSVPSETVYDISVDQYENYILENFVVTHNSGFKYATSTIITLSKSKEKEGNEVVGNIIRAKTHKSRLSKENQQVEIRLFYDNRGLDRYYGLPQLAAQAGIWPASGNRYLIDGKKVWEKEILRNPELYFTDEVMEQIDVVAKRLFEYGGGEDVEVDDEEVDIEDEV
jgi:hypothetical protein